nr:MAG TPA: hypothetical protein [Bacteriophage sp.]
MELLEFCSVKYLLYLCGKSSNNSILLININ